MDENDKNEEEVEELGEPDEPILFGDDGLGDEEEEENYL